ncbi:MAG: DNA adenine methylase [Bacteroidales bacterium]
MKNFTQAPLPFQGQKRRWSKDFKIALKQFEDCSVFIDLFGGSGLLSHYVKCERPDADVIYNDYDNYADRLANIPQTNILLTDIRTILKDYPSGKLIAQDIRVLILDRIKQEEIKGGYVDYVTLSSSLLFSAKYVTDFDMLTKESLYNNTKQSDYNANGYLDGIKVVKQDYRELFNFWRWHPSACFLVDPPYLSTDSTTYHNYWRLGSYLDVLQTVKDTNYFYFTSSKSQILELCEWIEANLDAVNPFSGAQKREIHVSLNHTSRYTDIMLYKRRYNG